MPFVPKGDRTASRPNEEPGIVTKLIAILVPTTSRGRPEQRIQDTDLCQRLLASLQATRGDSPMKLYLGFDEGDPLYDTPEAQDTIRAQAAGIEVRFVSLRGMQGAPCWIWNALARLAFQDGAQFFYQLGDDVRLLTPGWSEEFPAILKSRAHSVTGPIDVNNHRSVASGLLTNAFVSRDHLERYDGIYPGTFKNWFSDDWISQAYSGSSNCQSLTQWVENSPSPPRYEIDSEALKTLSNELDKSAPAAPATAASPPQFSASRILIAVTTWNRPTVTRLCLEQLWRHRAGCRVEIWDDHSAYGAEFLQDVCTAWIRRPCKLGVDGLRWLAIRDFVAREEFDFLYLTDNDAYHDPRFLERLQQLYEQLRLPLSLYNSPIHDHPDLSLAEKGDYLLRRLAPGVSMFLTRPMAERICGALRTTLHLPPLPWDLLLCQLLGMPWAVSSTSFVEHLGAGGLHNGDFERDRALHPTPFLVHSRQPLLAQLPRPGPT